MIIALLQETATAIQETTVYLSDRQFEQLVALERGNTMFLAGVLCMILLCVAGSAWINLFKG